MLGFTPKERKFLIFLLLTFFIGLSIRIFQIKWKPSVTTPSLGLNNNLTRSQMKYPATPDSIPGNITTNNNKYVFLNKAEFKEFLRLPGIGPVKAKRIIQYRKANGSFESLNDLTNVKGIGEKTIKKLEPFIKIH